MNAKRYDNDFYKWGSLWNVKSLWHFFGSGLIFTFTFYLIHWLRLDDELQSPKLASGVATLLVIFCVEYVQVLISKAYFDLTDISVGIAAILTMWIIL